MMRTLQRFNMVVDIKLVLVMDGIGEICTNILNLHGIQTIRRPNILRKDLLNDLYTYDAIVVRPDAEVTREILAAAFRLKVVALASPGCGKIDVEAASNRGISVINAPNSTVISACELICGLLLAVAKQMRPARNAFSKGIWNYGSFIGNDVKGRTVAIIGCGRVGKKVASRMTAFGMKVVGFDPLLAVTHHNGFCTMIKDLNEIWPIADYIVLLGDYVLYSIIGYDPFATEEQCKQFFLSKMTPEERPEFHQWLNIHSALLEPNRNFINADILRRCKTGVKIINVGRGGLINESDLLDALNSGQVGGAAIDVLEGQQSDPVTLTLIDHPLVIATPHIATSTADVSVHAAKEIAEQIINLVKPGTYSTMLSEINKIYD
ncbi:PREDICTED: D-3-phosphoglycerate dehydrogenase-like isoform X2 [Papilio polytes]|uniref:D-3-phosphoglycerate dehydrogenase-like isoform X2 n=1 Tax=Papilio polytes TaxID=76194 RepID=UPI0006766D40|nr:PREDICTED: D-3-phosphoglycerate dehydrogenase-like isoform X2 [Papilio polytes]